MQVKGEVNENYFVNICHSTRGCKSGSSVCTADQTSYGTWKGSRFIEENEHVKLEFAPGDACAGTGRDRTASILFVCDENDVTSETKPELLTSDVRCVVTKSRLKKK